MKWFAVTNFHFQALSTRVFFLLQIYMANNGLQQEIFVTKRLSRTSRKFLACKQRPVYSYMFISPYYISLVMIAGVIWKFVCYDIFFCFFLNVLAHITQVQSPVFITALILQLQKQIYFLYVCEPHTASCTAITYMIALTCSNLYFRKLLFL